MKSLNMLVIGGDERYLTTIRFLSEQKHHIHVIGFQQFTFNNHVSHHSTLATIPVHLLNAIILPVSGVNSRGEIKLNSPSHSIHLPTSFVSQTPDDCQIVTGVVTPYLERICSQTKRKLSPIFNRHDVAIHNSIPTAEGALQLALENTKKTIHGSNILVLGFGRIGMTIARLFSNVGAHVTVAARKASDFARIKEMSLTTMNVNKLTQIKTFDIFINTIPHLILTDHVIRQMNKQALIIDLASAPGGSDFDAAESEKIQALLALGLPGKVAPITAGKIIANTILNIIK